MLHLALDTSQGLSRLPDLRLCRHEHLTVEDLGGPTQSLRLTSVIPYRYYVRSDFTPHVALALNAGSAAHLGVQHVLGYYTSTTMDEPPDVATLIAGLTSESESARKYAVYKLQSLLSDPSFADAFVQGEGLESLRHAVLETNGNTQAYALGSLDALLELDMGWDAVDAAVIEKVGSINCAR